MKRLFISLFAGLVMTWAGHAARKPNVILIVGDDMGYGDIGAHGCTDIPTPHIDSLVKGGVRCTNGYVSGTYCSPTRAALLTGRYQQRFGHEFNPGPAPAGTFGLRTDQKTLGDHFAAAGYKTGWVGKWHLGNKDGYLPGERGFQETFGFLGGAHAYFARNRAVGARANDPIRRNGQPIDEPEYLTDAFAREAVAFIHRHRADPFFLYLAFNAVHTPMEATDARLERFKNIADARRRTYAAMMSAMDEAIGQVLGKIRDAGLDESTLIFFISDNGGPPANGSSNGPLRGRKAQTWEGGIRVPFLARWKGRLPEGKTFKHPVIQIDLAPTAFAACGLEKPATAEWEGVNLLPYWKGEMDGAPHEVLFWRFGEQMAVRRGAWKLVAAPGSQGRELFNLDDDPGEKKNLAESRRDTCAELEAAWNEWDGKNISAAWMPARATNRRRPAQ